MATVVVLLQKTTQDSQNKVALCGILLRPCWPLKFLADALLTTPSFALKNRFSREAQDCQLDLWGKAKKLKNATLLLPL